MDYSAFNPMAWGAFGAFVLLVWAAVRLFKAKYPDYPGGWPETDRQGTRDTDAPGR